MNDLPSSQLLARSRQGDSDASEALFSRYVERLTRLARSRLSRKLAARVDPEDVVQSAYRSFFRLASNGDVHLHQSGDLWRLLARITLRKVCRSARRHLADCRTVDREEAWPTETEAALLAREPSPAEAAALIDELRCALEPLSPAHRRIVELRLQGHEVADIAAAVQRSARTVRRTLAGLGEHLEARLIDPAPLPTPAGRELLAYADVILQQQLGAGGMGKVYRALLRRDHSTVAVKLLRKPLRQHQVAVARFLEEADLLARLRHPGIVAIRAIGLLPDGGHFLVMDLVEGADLGRQLAAGQIPVEKALAWVAEAADAIEYAHRHGIVHCDLKPSNLLLGVDGRIRVTDFGLARSLADDGPAAGGTPGFMALEQADPAHGLIGPRTDVFGLGAVLYALLAGRPPFTDSPASPLSTIRPDVPRSVELLCRRCLEAKPENRPSSAAELAAALREATDHSAAGSCVRMSRK
jgi:RNA polymerase sigma factor (sigma-70 family)